jgi:hypothetical protein
MLNQAVEFLAYPMKIRGYGHVKERKCKSKILGGKAADEEVNDLKEFPESASGIAAE